MKQSISKKTRESTAFLYSRLSRDDNLDGDSYSITNQKKLLTKVAKEKGYTNLVHFFDDGKSGVTMDRPGFNKMMRELEKGKASAVFFKDMSRLGRNYIEVGRLCEEFFPENDIRYVAVSDNVDSDEGENELTPIRNLFNEWYSRDISKKKRLSNTIKGNSGLPMGFPPYGYVKDPDDIHKWIIEPEAAGVVNRVFTMYVSGYGTDQIASIFSEEKLLTPTAYYKKYGLRRPANKRSRGPYDWNSSTIHNLLRRQEYCGDIINFKSYSKSYKSKKRIPNEKEDMAIFEGVHEPIVSREVFEKAQNKHGKGRHRTKQNGERNMFSGFLRCADCGSIMNYHFNQGNRSIEYFNCPKNNRSRKTCDKTHYIRTDFLEQVVLAEVRRLARFVRDNEDDFLKMVKHNVDSDGIEKNKFKEKELGILQARDKELDVIFENLYEDNVSGKISDDRFVKLSLKYEKEQEAVVNKINTLVDELEHEKTLDISLDWFVDAIKKFSRIRKLSSDMLHELIESIDVYHAEKVDGMTQQQLTIYYNCIGAVTLPEMERDSKPVVSINTRKGVEVNYAFA